MGEQSTKVWLCTCWTAMNCIIVIREGSEITGLKGEKDTPIPTKAGIKKWAPQRPGMNKMMVISPEL